MRWFALAMSLCAIGCASAWVVRQSPEGGTIGYKGYSDNESATEAVTKLIHCPNNYRVVGDEMRSNQFTYTTYQPVTVYGNTNGTVTNAWNYGQSYNYSGTQSYTANVPVTNVGTNAWREMTYACDGNRSVASEPAQQGAIPLKTYDACGEKCVKLYAKGQLKKGMGIDDCIEAMCK